MKANLPQIRISKGWPRKVTSGNVTVTVYRVTPNTGYTAYQVADMTSGKRKLITFGDEGEATQKAIKLVELLAAGQVHAASFSNEQAASFGRATALLRPTGVALEVAAGIFAEAYKILGGSERVTEAARDYARRNPSKLPRKTVASAVNEFLVTKRNRGASERYLEDLKARLTNFADAFKKNVADVTTAQIQSWLDKRKMAPQTYRNYRTVLQTFFNFCIAKGYALKGENPAVETEKPAVKNGSVGIFTPEQMQKLLEAASPEVLPCLAIGAFAGVRSAEVERMKWEHVDLIEKTITLPPEITKTAGGRQVPIQPNLEKLLAPYGKRKGPIWTGTHKAFYDAQQRTIEAVNAALEKGEAKIEWLQNGLRHSFGSYRMAILNDPGRVAGEMGNSAAVVNRHYKQVVKPSAAKAFFSIGMEGADNVVGIGKTATK